MATAFEPDLAFSQVVQDRSGEPIQRCYFCQKCTAGCPVAYAMDYKPAQVLRLVQFGQKEAIFSSSAIWLCVGCKTCGTRCPNQIHLAAVFDTLRYMALEGGYKSEPAIYALHRSFLDSIRLWGRLHELSMLLEYKLRSRDPFSDVAMGIGLIRKGKLSFLPERIQGLAQVRGLYETATDRSSAEVGT